MEFSIQNHMMPFFWQHGEDEETLRHYMKIIDEKARDAILEITSASEGVEVFLDGKNLGIQVTEPFLYHLQAEPSGGAHTLDIEIATTLERERKKKNAALTGLTGEVRLYVRPDAQAISGDD